MMRARGSLNWGAIAAATLRLLGWLAVNALAAAGIVALVAFAVGSFSLPLTMAQLANLADRYVVAGHARQGQFDHIVVTGFCAAFLAVAFFRRAGLVRAFETGENHHG
jgi:hypothetical protein